MSEAIGIGVVGTGDWGANLIRNFAALPGCSLNALCDSDAQRLAATVAKHPKARAVPRLEDLANAQDVQGVVVSASAVSHYPIAKTLLEAGKDVYVEKPLALQVDHAEELVRARRAAQAHPHGRAPAAVPPGGALSQDDGRARRAGRPLLHLFAAREPGQGAHGRERAVELRAPRPVGHPPPARAGADRRGRPRLGIPAGQGRGRACSSTCASPAAGWRTSTCRGSTRTSCASSPSSAAARWSCSTTWRRARRSASTTRASTASAQVVSYGDALTVRSGDIVIPKISLQEPLRIECQHFVDCVRDRKAPLTDGMDGLRVVKVLAAAQASLERGGAPVAIARERGGGVVNSVDPCTSTAAVGRARRWARAASSAPSVRLGTGCRLGHHVVIHADTVIGNDVRIDDHATLGKLPMRAANSATTKEQELPPLTVGDLSIVGTGVVLLSRRRDRRQGADGGPVHRARERHGRARHDRRARRHGRELLHRRPLLQARERVLHHRVLDARGSRVHCTRAW